MSLKGIDALKRRIGSVRDAIANGEAFQEAGEAWIEQDFKPYAKQIVPVRSGELRDSIDGAVNENQIRVFADAPHAAAVEEGTSKQAAQPFMRPAFLATRAKLSARTRAALKKRIT